MNKTATIPEGCGVVSYLTAGRTYDIIEETNVSFYIIDDEGEKITALKNNDPQLGYLDTESNFKNWIIN
jgi:hypothetical protein